VVVRGVRQDSRAADGGGEVRRPGRSRAHAGPAIRNEAATKTNGKQSSMSPCMSPLTPGDYPGRRGGAGEGEER